MNERSYMCQAAKSPSCVLVLLTCFVWGCSQKDPNQADAASGSGGTSGSGSGMSGSGMSGSGMSGSGGGGVGASGAGGGGEPDAGGAGTDAGPGGVADDFYPLVDGARWTYAHRGGAIDWDEVVEQRATEYMGAPAVLLLDNAGPSGTRSETVLTSDGTRVLRVYREEFASDVLQLSATYVPGFLRYNGAWEGEAPGYTEDSEYERTEYDSSDRITAQAGRIQRFTVEALDDAVEVAAGSFDGCVRIRRVRVRSPGTPAVAGDDKLYWFCPGIGKVREEDPMTGQYEELVSCTVPGGACP